MRAYAYACARSLATVTHAMVREPASQPGDWGLEDRRAHAGTKDTRQKAIMVVNFVTTARSHTQTFVVQSELPSPHCRSTKLLPVNVLQ